jgi:hypothetical protein
VERIGIHPSGMRAQQEEDIFISRLHLMIVMAKAYLKNYQLGGYRAIAIKNNAARLAEAPTGWHSYKTHFSKAATETTGIRLDHILFQRIRLLLVMGVSFAEENPMGPSRKRALRNNIDYITECLNFSDISAMKPVLSAA